jgi:hypothetical protein
LSALLAVGALGCSKSDEPSTTLSVPAQGKAVDKQPALEPPAAAVSEFLEAVRTGNDDKASQMLSAVSRKKLAETGLKVTPPASDTAHFEVGKVEHVSEDGARVDTVWTDLDENGKPKPAHAMWVVRREDGNWRVAGVAATVFDGEPPLLLNFEDPADMTKKLEWLRQEGVRRSQGEKIQANDAEKSQEPFRR